MHCGNNGYVIWFSLSGKHQVAGFSFRGWSKKEFPCNLGILLLGIYSQNKKTYVQLCTSCRPRPREQQYQCPTTDEDKGAVVDVLLELCSF